MKENKEQCGEFTEEERKEKIDAICERYAERFEKIGSDWEKLNELAHEAFAKADKCLKEKQYKAFAMHLRFYSYLWKYAGDHLDPMKFMAFCAGQNPDCCEWVM